MNADTETRTASAPRRRIGSFQRPAVDRRRRELLFASAEVVGQFGVWDWRPRDGQLLWSDNLYRIYGYEPQALTA